MGQSQSNFISKLTKEHGASASVAAAAKPTGGAKVAFVELGLGLARPRHRVPYE